MVQRKQGARDNSEEEAREPFQAVLLADSFAQRFRPITLEQPKVLLPLVNIPLIDYTLEWLASSGVEEVFVFCCAHSRQIVDHLKTHHASSLHQKQGAAGSNPQSGGSNPGVSKGFRIVPVVAHDCLSVGDAMRHLDHKAVIRSDFVLVSGDMLSTLPLLPLLREHKDRRKRDKQAVMTMAVRKGAKRSVLTGQTRTGSPETILAVDSSTQQLLMYEAQPDGGVGGGGLGGVRAESRASSSTSLSSVGGGVGGRGGGGGRMRLDRVQLEEHGSLEVLSEVEDCYIDICAPEVLYLFTDNFDYQLLRLDFVRGVLNDDIMGNKIFVSDIGKNYAARVDSLRSYGVISRDILRRAAYPLVPDSKFSNGGSGKSSPSPISSSTPSVTLSSGFRYKGAAVSLSRSSSLSPYSLLGEGTVVAEASRITESVIGRDCVIGRHVSVAGSYIWDDVRIGENATVTHSVVCSGARIGEGAVVGPGSVISFNVVIGPGCVLPPYSQVSLKHQPEADEKEEEEDEVEDEEETEASGASASDDSMTYDETRIGPGGRGFLWDDREEEVSWKFSMAPLSVSRLQQLVKEEEEEMQEEEEAEAAGGRGRLAEAQSGGDVEEEEEEEEEDDEDQEFAREVGEMFVRAVEEGVQEDNVVLEINAVKMAYNRSFADCAAALFTSILQLIAKASPEAAARDLVLASKSSFKKWAPLLRRFLKSQDDEVEVLLTFEELCAESLPQFAPVFVNVLEILYDCDVVCEEAVLSWADEKKFADEVDKVFLNHCLKFIQWLQEAEEDEDEKDDE